jgi:phosphonopyruvate decarboxylase
VIAADRFCAAARAAGFRLYAGVPCSYLTPLIDHVVASSAEGGPLRYVGAADEGSAVAIAAGAGIAGERGVVLLQNSGLGNAVSPLTSLCAVFALPVLLVVTLRGEPGGPPDEPQHALMGAITTRLLELTGVAWEAFPSDDDAVAPALARAVAHMETKRTPYALVARKGSVGPGAANDPGLKPGAWKRGTQSPAPPGSLGVRIARREPGFTRRSPLPRASARGEARPSRHAVLEAVRRALGPRDVVLATTGHTGRALYALGDRENQLYLVGSMGCASSFALGVALAAPSRRVVVLDGDGAALMRLGALATIGHERPENLVHVVLDNESHESTGGQPTVSDTADLGAVARACGYPRVVRAASASDAGDAVSDARGLTMIHAKVTAEPKADLPRPSIAPRDAAARLRAFLASGQA